MSRHISVRRIVSPSALAHSPVLSLGLSFASLLSLGSTAQAASLSWTSTANSTLGGTGTWNTVATNWWNGASAQAWTPNTTTDNTAVLAGTAGTLTLGEGINALGLQVTTTGYTVALAGNTLSLGAGGLDASTLTSGTTTISGTGTVALTGVQPWNVGSGATVAVSSVIGGTGITLTKSGAGTLALSGANSYTGTTSITGGTLSIAANNHLGTSAVTLDGGTLASTAAGAMTNTHVITVGANGGTLQVPLAATGAPEWIMGNANNLAGSGALTISGTGTLGQAGANTSAISITNANTYSGAVTIQNGAIAGVKNVNGLGTTSTITVGNLGLLSINNFTFARPVSVNGGGVLGWDGGGTHSGTITLNGAATVRMQNWWGAGTVNGTISGQITGTGGITVNNGSAGGTGGALTLNNNTNNYSGGTTLNTGTLTIGANGALGTGSLSLNGGILNNSAAVTGLANNIAVAGTTAIQLGSNNNMTLTGTLSGTGALTLGNSGNNSSLYLGVTNTMTSGSITQANNTNSVRFNSAAAGNANVAWTFNNATANRGTLDFADGGTIHFGSMSGTGILQGNGAAVRTISVGNLNADTTFSGVIGNGSGTTAVTKVGTGIWTLSGANTYTGATTVSGGTLQVGNGTTGTIAGTSAVSIAPGSTLALNLPATTTTLGNAITNNGTLSILSPNDLTLSGAIEGTGSIQKAVAGTLTLGGFSGTTGTLNVSAGKLQANGFLDTAPVTLGAATLGGSGSVGAVTVNDSTAVITNGNANTDDLQVASLAFSTAATLSLNKSNDTESPALAIAGNLATSPGTVINLATSPAWVSGQTYKLISYGSLTGSAANLVKGTIPGLGGRQSATLGTTGASNGYVTLAIGGDSPYWTGANNNTWTTAVMSAPKNWKLIASGTTTDFQTNDQVLFNDNATGSTAVNISAANVPVVAVTFDNSSKDYTITSTGGFGIVDGSSAASLTKTGTGTVTIATTNNFSGATNILAGTLVLGDGTTNGTISNSASITNDGTLVFNRTTGSSFNYGNPIAGVGDLVKSGSGTQTLSGANTYSGLTTINAGTLQVGNGGNTGNLSTATITNNGSLVFNRSNAVVQGADFGPIEGAGSVTQSGTDLLTLSFTNNYSGGTTVNSGTLVVGSPEAIGTGGIVANGGAIRYTGAVNGTNVNPLVVNGATVLDVNTNWNLNGNITGSGDITRGTLATQSLWLGGDNSGYTGTFTIPANGNAVVRFTNPTAGSAAAKWVVNQNVASRVSLSFVSGTIHLGSLTGTGFLSSQGAGNTVEVGQLGLTETFAGVIEGNAANAVSVTKVGAGTLTLTGANTYSGATTISAGTLQLGDGTLDGTIAATSGVTNNASLIYNWANAHAAPYAISGTGSLTKNGAGALTLGGTNTYTGDTILNAGSIVVDGDSIADSGKVAINGGTIALTGTEVVGSLEFGGVPQATGTWGATGSGATHIDDTRFTGTGMLQVGGAASAYTSWASTKGLTTGVNDGAEQDAEFDGIANALEFVLGGNPLASDTSKLPVLTTDANNFIFTFNRADESEAEITLTFQYGSSLAGWTDVTIGADNAHSGSGVNITENDALADTVVVTVPKTSAVGGKLFGRLRAVK